MATILGRSIFVTAESKDTTLVVDTLNVTLVTEPKLYNVVTDSKSEATPVIVSSQAQVVQTNTSVIINAEEMDVYSKRIDFITDNLLYRAEAAVGSATSSPVWRIRRVTISPSDSDIDEVWASGNAYFDKVWDDRLGYSYI